MFRTSSPVERWPPGGRLLPGCVEIAIQKAADASEAFEQAMLRSSDTRARLASTPQFAGVAQVGEPFRRDANHVSVQKHQRKSRPWLLVGCKNAGEIRRGGRVTKSRRHAGGIGQDILLRRLLEDRRNQRNEQ